MKRKNWFSQGSFFQENGKEQKQTSITNILGKHVTTHSQDMVKTKIRRTS